MKLARHFPLFSLTLLAACGGGGSDSPTSPSPVVEPDVFTLGDVYVSTTLTPEWGAAIQAPATARGVAEFYSVLLPGQVSEPRTVHLGRPTATPGLPFALEGEAEWLLAPDGLTLQRGWYGFVDPSSSVNAVTGATWWWDREVDDWRRRDESILDSPFGLYANAAFGQVLVTLENVVPTSLAPDGIRVRRLAGPLRPMVADFEFYFGVPPVNSIELELAPGATDTVAFFGGTYLLQVENLTTGDMSDLVVTIPPHDYVLESLDLVTSLSLELGSEAVTSDNPMTQASILYPGLDESANRAPTVVASATVPEGVTVIDRETGGPPGPTSRHLRIIEPSIVEGSTIQFADLMVDVVDPEGDMSLEVLVDTGDFLSPGIVPMASPFDAGSPWTASLWAPNRTLRVTFFDDEGLAGSASFQFEQPRADFDSFEIHVEDDLVDYGRRFTKRTAGCAPLAPEIDNLTEWVDTDQDGLRDTPRYKLLETGPSLIDPDQDPGSLTAVYRIAVFSGISTIQSFGGPPADSAPGDDVFSLGSYYAAVDVPSMDVEAGDLLTPTNIFLYRLALEQRAANGEFGVDLHQFPDANPNAYVLPILFEAPPLASSSGVATNDCAEFGSCAAEYGLTYLQSWTNAVTPRSRVAWPDDEAGLRTELTLVPDPIRPAPDESLTLSASTFPRAAGASIEWSITSSDGMTLSETRTTDAEGCSEFVLPPAPLGTTHDVVVTCLGTTLEVTYGR